MKLGVPRFGIYSNIIKGFLEDLGLNVLMCPKITREMIKAGVANSSDMFCLSEDSNITISDYTSKPIKDVRVGNEVLTHKGRFRKVTRTFVREYNGELLNIDCGGFFKLTITPEHPVLSLKRGQITCHKASSTQLPIVCRPGRGSVYCQRHNQGCRQSRGLIDFTPRFISANELRKGDFIAIPVPKILVKRKQLTWKWDLRYNRRGSYFAYCKYKNKTFPFTPETLRFLGYYLAEGSMQYNWRQRKKSSNVTFTFSSEEDDYINEVQSIARANFSCSTKTYNPKPTVRDVKIYSKSLADMVLYLCGEHSNGKKICPEVMRLHPQLQMELLKGFFRGDGHLEPKTSHYSGATTSRNLANQLFWILIRNNIKASFWGGQQANRKPHYVLKVINRSDINRIDNTLNVTLRQSKKRPFDYIKKDDNIFVPIRSIEEQQFKGKVYNLEVEDDNSYVANGLAVHNCFPFKYTLGQEIWCLEQGATDLLFYNSCGLCRLKHYYQIQELTLRELGYRFKMNVVTKKNIVKVIGQLGHISRFRVYRELKKLYSEIKAIEARTYRFLPTRDLKIGIVGEIGTMLEPDINFDIVKKLQRMGVNVHMSLTLTDYLNESTKRGGREDIKEAKKLLTQELGGHGFESIVNSIFYGKNGYDGLIHLMPLSCSPEATVERLVDYVAEKYQIPLYRFPIDESAFEVGFDTRLSTFCSMLKRRKLAKNG